MYAFVSQIFLSSFRKAKFCFVCAVTICYFSLLFVFVISHGSLILARPLRGAIALLLSGIDCGLEIVVGCLFLLIKNYPIEKRNVN